MGHFECEMSRSHFPEKEARHGLRSTATRRLVKTLRGFRPSGPGLFVGGLELWFYAQVHWFSSSFRLQAVGVAVLVYWILGALWCMGDRGVVSLADRRE
jgi:hypothetical protein